MLLTIQLPTDHDILIKPGDQVDFTTPLVKRRDKTEKKIDLTKILKIQPKQIFQSLKKFVGDSVKKGDVIAEHSGMFGKKRFHSDIEGVIKEINHNEGTLVLEIDSDAQTTILSFFVGEVKEIKDDNKIELKVKEYKDFELKDASDYFGGEVFYYTKDKINEVSEEDVTNKVIFSENIDPYEQAKLEALGARGFILAHNEDNTPAVPHGQIKTEADWNSIHKLKLPYCIIETGTSKIYLYH